jgi:hypothetical protein
MPLWAVAARYYDGTDAIRYLLWAGMILSASAPRCCLTPRS